jgi:hypothetical protein
MRAVDAPALLSSVGGVRGRGRPQVLVSSCAECGWTRTGPCAIQPALKRAAHTGVSSAAEHQRQVGWSQKRRTSATVSLQSSSTGGSAAEATALDSFLEQLKWDANGLVVAIAQVRRFGGGGLHTVALPAVSHAASRVL